MEAEEQGGEVGDTSSLTPECSPKQSKVDRHPLTDLTRTVSRGYCAGRFYTPETFGVALGSNLMARKLESTRVSLRQGTPFLLRGGVSKQNYLSTTPTDGECCTEVGIARGRSTLSLGAPSLF